jgi:large subunit ribosomal protein L24
MGKSKLHVRKGDRVEVISGNYRGARGQVLRAIPRLRRVVVDGVNMRKRHQRPSAQNPEGGIVTFEAPIDVSNVMLVCPHCDEPARAGHRRDPDGTVERICKRCGEPIPTP